MQPLSEKQFKDAEAFTRPAPVQVFGDGRLEVWAVPLSMPGRGAMSFVFSTVILGAESVTIVDPGWPERDNLQASTFTPLGDFLATRGRSLTQVTDVIATHGHPDHMGAAQPLADHVGARLVTGAREMETIRAAQAGIPATDWVVDPATSGAPPEVLQPMLEEQATVRDRWFLPNRTPEVLLKDGEHLADHDIAEGFDFQALLTPGHTPGHLALVDRQRKILIAADMILPQIFPGIGLGVAEVGGNPIEDYLDSLTLLKEFDDFSVIPGHGYCFTGLESRRVETAKHILQRAREVRAVLEQNPEATAWQIASQLTWSLGWEGMQQSRMLVSALRQTMMYRDLVLRRPLSHWLE